MQCRAQGGGRAALSSYEQARGGWTPRGFWELNLYSTRVSLAGGGAHGVVVAPVFRMINTPISAHLGSEQCPVTVGCVQL